MAETTFTLTDALVLMLMLGSAFLALMRGMIRETMAITTWLLAGVAAFGAYWLAGVLAGDEGDSTWLIQGFAAGLVFALVLYIATRLNRSVCRMIRDNQHRRMWDQILGFGFGLARGFLLAVIGVQVYVFAAHDGSTPDWLARSQMYAPIASTANALNLFSSDPITAPSDGARGSLTAAPRPAPRQADSEAGPADPGEDGYSDRERRQLDQLFRQRADED